MEGWSQAQTWEFSRTCRVKLDGPQEMKLGRFIVRIVVGSGHQANLIILDTVKEDELTEYKPCTANHLYSSTVLIMLVLVSLSLPA